VNPSRDLLVVGVDIGGTSVEAVVTDADGGVAGPVVHPTDASTPERVLASAVSAIRSALVDAGRDAGSLRAIGLGVPGQVDLSTGVVRLAMNLNLDDGGYPLGPLVQEEFAAPTTVENDARAAALAAYDLLRGTTPGLRTLAYLGIGTGIAAGLVTEGRVHRGRDGMAGEIGHVVVAPDGHPCRCGLTGCLEAMAAGPAIQRLWPTEGRPAEELFRAAAEGDSRAIRVAEEVSGHLALAVQWLVAAYGADLVALGGGVGSIGDPLLAEIRARLAELAERSDLARRMVPPDRVVALPAGFPSGAIGAAALARRRFVDGEGEDREREGGAA
jgi:predicted NBD/HSP70 family sugar kinase